MESGAIRILDNVTYHSVTCRFVQFLKPQFRLGGRAMEGRELPRREREKLAQRQEMLAAALDLFSKKGYRNVSMHEIAEKAEFAVGTLYKFLSLIHISEPTRLRRISYAVF